MEERHDYGDIDGSMILKWILEKYDNWIHEVQNE
jgi:hypothetical protein